MLELETVVILIAARKNVFDHLWVVFSSLQDGWSPLMSVSEHGDCDILRLLIEQGANLNLQDKVSGV